MAEVEIDPEHAARDLRRRHRPLATRSGERLRAWEIPQPHRAGRSVPTPWLRRPAVRALRALPVAAVVTLLLASCARVPGPSSSPPPPATRTTTPRAALSSSLRRHLVPPGAGVQVRAGRFVRGVELDRGAMVVLPAPATEHPTVSEADADRLFRSDVAATGAAAGVELGYGRVSLRPSMTAAAGLPDLRDTAAWVGITWGGVWSCPFEPASGTGRATTGADAPVVGTTLPATPRALAVVVLSPMQVIDFRSGGSPCPGAAQPPARVTAATEAISVPWSLVSQAGFPIRYRYRAPACAPGLVPLPRAVGNLHTGAVQLQILLDVPYPDVACRGVLRSGSFDAGPPPGAPGSPSGGGGAPTVSHGPTGPVQVVGGSPSLGLQVSAGS